ncbi:RNA polymerase sigma factor [Metabacillus arenae]|uniref:RNA polymerase sigma factor n=1 Tax=Metabacillus arenae TaxID=2771434 RepID=A0A926S178_9BACI|nr:RNA polymerase sigma factor [Metabacillus arenae]MBD1380749.1 RNA polymerase sigma factor [Metabacillus arenae]
MKNRESPIEVIEDIYNKHYQYIFHFLLSLTTDKQLAEDIIQEVFSKILLQPEKILEINNIKSFLIKCAKNQLIDHYRKKKPSLFKDDQAIERLLVDNYSANKILEVNEINEILLKLPSKYSFVIIARDYYGYSYQEISDFLEISLVNVKSRIFRARKLFLTYYQEVNNGD